MRGTALNDSTPRESLAPPPPHINAIPPVPPPIPY